MPFEAQNNEGKNKMDDDFDYREILNDLDDFDQIYNMYEEIIEEEIVKSWILFFRNNNFAIFINNQGEMRFISSNYINNIFHGENE